MLFDVKSGTKTYWGVTSKEIIYHIERGNLPFHCKIYHPLKQRWEFLQDNHSLAREIAEKLSRKPLSYNYESLFHHWSIKNYLTHQGYFTLMEVIHKLQKSELSKKSVVNHPTLRQWSVIEKIPIFSEDNIRSLYKLQDLKEFFTPRKAPRPEA